QLGNRAIVWGSTYAPSSATKAAASFPVAVMTTVGASEEFTARRAAAPAIGATTCSPSVTGDVGNTSRRGANGRVTMPPRHAKEPDFPASSILSTPHRRV